MSFINNNSNEYFRSVISEELKKNGLKELDNESSPDKIFYCDISYGDRNNPNYSKCEIVNQLQNVNPLGNKKDQYNIHLKYYKTRPDYIPLTISFNRDNIEELRTDKHKLQETIDYFQRQLSAPVQAAEKSFFSKFFRK